MHPADRPRYLVEAFRTYETRGDGSDYDTPADTISEARKRARYCLSEDFRQSGEMAGRYGYARVTDTRDGSCPFDTFRTADKATAKQAAKLNDQAVTRGLYLDPPIEGVARVDSVRITLGYPADLIQLRNAYGPQDDPQWITLTPAARLFNQRGEALVNPVTV